MLETSDKTPCEYAPLMLRAARLCETLRVAVRSVHRMDAPELFGLVKKAQPAIADRIRQISRTVGQAMDLPLSPTLNTELIREHEIRDGCALEQFQASYGALTVELDHMAQHPALKDSTKPAT
jgi:hypothetical protein